MHTKPSPTWRAQREQRQLHQAAAQFTSAAKHPRRYQQLAGLSARGVMAGHYRPMPAGVCECAACRRVWEQGENQRQLVDLDNSIARRRTHLRLVRREG